MKSIVLLCYGAMCAMGEPWGLLLTIGLLFISRHQDCPSPPPSRSSYWDCPQLMGSLAVSKFIWLPECLIGLAEGNSARPARSQASLWKGWEGVFVFNIIIVFNITIMLNVFNIVIMMNIIILFCLIILFILIGMLRIIIKVNLIINIYIIIVMIIIIMFNIIIMFTIIVIYKKNTYIYRYLTDPV